MKATSLTNAQLDFTKQLLTEYQLKSLNFDNVYVKQMLYAQFKQLLQSLVTEVGDIYQLTNISGDFSISQSIDYLLTQSEDMAELNIIKNMMDPNIDSFINKIMSYRLDKDIQSQLNSIFTTVNLENEIFLEMKQLIQSIREMSVQQ